MTLAALGRLYQFTLRQMLAEELNSFIQSQPREVVLSILHLGDVGFIPNLGTRKW